MFTKLHTLFEETLALPEEKRAVFIEKSCEDNLVLKTELEKLLNNYHKAALALGDSFKNFAPQILQSATQEKEANTFEGKIIGSYKILNQLGRGGVGTVWLAERTDDIATKVAIKILRKGMDSEDILSRFRNERRFLAKLKHPNIATFIDGGVLEEGLPYFVMEYVEGISCIEYAKQNLLSVTQRIQLFRKICDAVAYAHQNLILHRDLKPSNILVKQDGTVKLLDFGIAKVLTTDETTRFSVLETATTARMLTPHYASPEQLQGLNLSNQSDIYQLGTLLFELLAHQHPFPHQSKIEVQNAIQNTAAPLASSVNPTLRKTLQGDLDTIVAATLRKEPERRYISVEHLNHDLQNYLAGFPLTIQKESIFHNARKFLKRNKSIVSLSIIFIFSLFLVATLFTINLVQERNNAQQKANEAAQVSTFLKDIFKEANPQTALGDTLNAFQLLEKGRTQLQTALKNEPLIQAELEKTLAEVYENLGDYQTSLSLLNQAIPTLEKHKDPNQVWLLRKRANVYMLLNNYKKSEDDLKRALEKSAQFNSADSVVADIYNGFGMLMGTQSKTSQAIFYYHKALAIHKKNKADIYEADILHNIAREYQNTDQLEKAEKTFIKVLSIRTELLPKNHPHILETQTALVVLRYLQDRFAEAEPLFAQILTSRLAVLGKEHPQTLTSMNDLGVVQMKQNKLKSAKKFLLASFKGRRKLFGEMHSQTAQSYNNLGQWNKRAQNYRLAIQQFKTALQIYKNLNQTDFTLQSAVSYFGLAETYQNIGDLNEGRIAAKKCLDIRKALLQPTHRDLKKVENLFKRIK